MDKTSVERSYYGLRSTLQFFLVLERGIKGHGSSSCVIPKTSAKSNSARRSSSSISLPLEGNILCDSRLCKAVGVALGFGLSTGIGR